ncbi:hypothetical protein Y032_0055g2615 [Ancylostoma ceylanicum]|uniref:Uncharacterized protein n=1 Tax=Ancylostoma ceylanicum TaxID=53326 RepID=A0A016U7L5_9BILA|nr:hypothetical protein Y032_0055g2615 [Ancylostoma ceylanicum]
MVRDAPHAVRLWYKHKRNSPDAVASVHHRSSAAGTPPAGGRIAHHAVRLSDTPKYTDCTYNSFFWK